MLATLFGVVSAYQSLTGSTQPEAAPATEIPVEIEPTEQFMSAVPTGIITPEQATTLAVQMIGRTDVYSVASIVHEGSPAYLVTFSSGDLVYVSPTGQIIAVTKLEPVVVILPPQNDDDDGNRGAGSGEHHDDDDHDDEDEDEHEDDD